MPRKKTVTVAKGVKIPRSKEKKLEKKPGGSNTGEYKSVKPSDYAKNVEEAIKAGKKRYTSDFFLVVLTKKERLMKNVLRNYFFSRSSCPTPEWDQAVYHYHAEPDHLDFLWVIPSRDTCRTLKDNALKIPQSERPLLDFILAFEDGSLLGKAKKLNGEMDDSLLLA